MRLVCFLVMIALLLLLSCLWYAEGRVDVRNVLASMSIKHRIGQLALPIIVEATMTNGVVDQAKIDTQFSDYGIGSMFSVWPPTGDGWTCNQWIEALTKIQQRALDLNYPPILFGLDSVHGANFIFDATIFPHNIGAAATYDPQLIEERARITAKDMRTCGFSHVFTPTADIALQPLWARHYETYGDDPYLVSVLSYYTVKGTQETNMSTPDFDYGGTEKRAFMCGAVAKHWIGYSTPDNGADRQPGTIPDWVMLRHHLPPFAAVLNDVKAMMISSGTVNGVPTHGDKKLLTDLLRNTLKWEGYLMSDFNDIIGLIQRNAATSFEDAVIKAVNAGLDVSLYPNDGAAFRTVLHDVVQRNLVPQKRVDDAALAVLAMKDAVGLFDRPFAFPSNAHTVGSAEDKAAAARMAEASLTLLKNKDNVLPIILDNDHPKKILITGAAGNSRVLLSGGWTFDWQGAAHEGLFRGQGSTIFTGFQQILQERAPSWSVEYIEGCGTESLAANAQEALQAAETADYVIVTIGERNYAEMLYPIGSLELPGHQMQFVKDLRARARVLIVVVVQGRPRTFNPIIEEVDAILYAYLPGPEGGLPIAKVLTGISSPSGRLPFSYPSESGIAMQRLVRDPDAYPTSFPFGFGLTYTTFEYLNISLSTTDLLIAKGDESLVVTVEVQNTGPRDGTEVVQLYMTEANVAPTREETPSTTENKHWMLKRFKKVHIPKGRTAKIVFTLSGPDFRYLAPNNATVKIKAGGSAADDKLVAVFTHQRTAPPVPLGTPDNLGTDTVVTLHPDATDEEPSIPSELPPVSLHEPPPLVPTPSNDNHTDVPEVIPSSDDPVDAKEPDLDDNEDSGSLTTLPIKYLIIIILFVICSSICQIIN